MPGVDPYSTALEAGGVTLNAITGMGAARAQKGALNEQKKLLRAQRGVYQQVAPVYQNLVNQVAQYAGLGGEGAPSQAERATQFGLGGGWGTYEDQLRLKAAQEDIARQGLGQEQQLTHSLGMRGVGPNILAAALARNRNQQASQYNAFRRNLAIEAPHEQERRLQLLQNAIAYGLGQGGAAAGGYAQLGGQYGQEAASNYANLANILQQYGYQRQLGQQPNLGGAGSDYQQQYLTPQQRAAMAF